jgi:phosphatidylglycerophosphate synthase
VGLRADLSAGAAIVVLVLLGLSRFDHAGVLSFAFAAAVFLSIAACIAVRWADHRDDFGWPNRVTLLRAALVAVLVGSLVWTAERGSSLVLPALAGVALVLDGLDGWLARRLDRTTEFGARFDMEIDALLILVLCAAVWWTGKADAWVLAIGLMRYLFIAASWLLPALAGPLAPSRMRKIVCVVQGVTLAVCLLPGLERPWTEVLLLAALSALSFSFCRDIVALLRHAPKTEPQRRNP